MPFQEIAVTEIGAVARQLLDSAPEASVMGVTSRGLFIQLTSGWVIFVSSESFRGPLTLNASAALGGLKRLKSGAAVNIAPGRISIPDAGVILDMQAAQSWAAPAPSLLAASPADRETYLSQVVHQALALGKTSPVSALLPFLLGFVNSTPASGSDLYNRSQNLIRALKARDPAKMAVELEGLLGLGSGLTPSGDDLIMGFLLTVKRWGHVLAPGLDLAHLAPVILPLATQKTTTLSANLIECALSGQANERLILALDGILTGVPDPGTSAGYLAGWGNTSGLDALVGLTLAIGFPVQ